MNTQAAAKVPNAAQRDPLASRLQARMKAAGYYAGAIDGDWGKLSDAAFDQLLAAAGTLDPCAITADRLRQVIPTLTPGEAAMHAEALEACRLEGGLTSTRRVRHFLAQAATETGGFKRLRESFAYRDPVHLDRMFSAVRDVHQARALIAKGPEAIANTVYANRYGNGDVASGDGWRMRGGGYLQITFRDNYREIGKAIGLPLEEHPELLEEPLTAAKAAARYWAWRKINAAADRDDTTDVTRLINPALAGLEDRIAWSGRFRVVYP